MARFRLRFLLQEVELAGTGVILGRSDTCHVTLEDPMVSRRHAHIQLSSPQPIISDLGSRNGVRVNGELITCATPLRHEDRIRLGTQDLVLVEVGHARSEVSRTTNGVRLCAACRSLDIDPSAGCLHCGAAASASVASSFNDLPTAPFPGLGIGWMLDLLDEVFERTLTAGRLVEAQRALSAIADEIETRRLNEQRIDASARGRVSSYALRLAEAQGNPAWMHWVLRLHEIDEVMLPVELVECFERDAPSLRRAVRAELSTYLEGWWARSGAGATASERALAERLASADSDELPDQPARFQ